MSTELCNSTRGNSLLAFDDLSDAPCNVGLRCLCFRSLVNGDDKVRYDMCGNLHIHPNQCSEEFKDRLERSTSDKR